MVPVHVVDPPQVAEARRLPVSVAKFLTERQRLFKVVHGVELVPDLSKRQTKGIQCLGKAELVLASPPEQKTVLQHRHGLSHLPRRKQDVPEPKRGHRRPLRVPCLHKERGAFQPLLHRVSQFPLPSPYEPQIPPATRQRPHVPRTLRQLHSLPHANLRHLKVAKPCMHHPPALSARKQARLVVCTPAALEGLPHSLQRALPLVSSAKHQSQLIQGPCLLPYISRGSTLLHHPLHLL
mmetsp:Transcript_35143/g.82095  ORF Transcript_35143/g.82095 Transcript_35143/m.82095 type:complete len:237 (-) Transcript_35143:9-719(-)